MCVKEYSLRVGCHSESGVCVAARRRAGWRPFFCLHRLPRHCRRPTLARGAAAGGARAQRAEMGRREDVMGRIRYNLPELRVSSDTPDTSFIPPHVRGGLPGSTASKGAKRRSRSPENVGPAHGSRRGRPPDGGRPGALHHHLDPGLRRFRRKRPGPAGELSRCGQGERNFGTGRSEQRGARDLERERCWV